MVNHINQPLANFQLTWQSILWRLVVTILLLILLAGSGITIFNNVTTHPNTRVLPTLTYDHPDPSP
jgi:hypothetical protein